MVRGEQNGVKLRLIKCVCDLIFILRQREIPTSIGHETTRNYKKLNKNHSIFLLLLSSIKILTKNFCVVLNINYIKVHTAYHSTINFITFY